MTTDRDHALATAAGILERRFGVRLERSAHGRLSRAITELARAENVDAHEYVDRLEEKRANLQGLVDRVTIQETAFFRDTAQFEALAQHVLPALSEPFTIWSAACANGQEPYSIAMLLDELGYTKARVYATDVSTRSLERTRRARYSSRELQGLSEARRERHLVRTHDGFEIAPRLQARVDVAFHNLVTDPPPLPPGSCPLVLCRNVLIYFGPEEVERVLDRIAQWLPIGGWLFLGYSESLWRVTNRWQLVRVGDAFVYRRDDREAPRVSAAPLPPNKKARVVPRKALARLPRTARRKRREPEPADLSVARLKATGDEAMSAGEHTTAIAAYRKCAYLAPAQPVMHLRLGFALEASGDDVAARRAYAAARAALDDNGAAALDSELEGYNADELSRLLHHKLVEHS